MTSKRSVRFIAVILAMALFAAAFPVTALAYGSESPPEETHGEVTILTDEEVSDQFSSLFGSDACVIFTGDTVQISTGTADTGQSGTVITKSSLNVRTGPGLDHPVFTQLPNGSKVDVIGKDGDWLKVRLSDRTGYVHCAYVTLGEAKPGVSTENGCSFTMSREELSKLLALLTEEKAAQSTPGEKVDGTEPTKKPEESPALTPDGNLTLLDDIGSSIKSGKQFVTMETRGGNVFYLIIDRDDKGEETVHFLNQVDEADLMNILADGKAEERPIVCTCIEKCAAGKVDMSCPICKNTMSECTGRVPVTEPSPTIPEKAEEKGGAGAALIALLVILLAAGGGVYFLVLKPKREQKIPSDLDDLDLEDEEEFFTENDEI